MNTLKAICSFGLVLALTCAAQTGPETTTAVAKAVKSNSTGETPDPVPVTGGGTPLTIPMFATPTALGDSVIKQDAAGKVGIGGIPFAGARLGVTGNISAAGDVDANNVTSRAKITATGDITTATGVVSGAQYNIGPGVALSSPSPDFLVLGDSSTSATHVGINTTTPKTALQITKGDLYIDTRNRGIILRSVNGHNCGILRLDDSASGPQLRLDPITCP